MKTTKLALVAMLAIGIGLAAAAPGYANDLDKAKPTVNHFKAWVHRTVERNTATIDKAQDAVVKSVDKANVYVDKEQKAADDKKTATAALISKPAAVPTPRPAPKKAGAAKPHSKKTKKA